MMKYLFAAIIILAKFSLVQAQSYNQIFDEKSQQLRADSKIASITMRKYQGNDTLRYESRVYTYDTLGKVLGVVGYSPSSKEPTWETDYKYDNKGRLQEIGMKEKGVRQIKASYKYMDNPKRMEKTEIWNDGGRPYKMLDRYTYMDDSLVIKYEAIWSDESWVSINTYNDKKQKIATFGIAAGDTTGYSTYNYDMNGNMVREVHYGKDKVLTRDERSAYGPNNELLATRYFNVKGQETGSNIYTYENGLISNYKTIAGGKEIMSVDRIYDPNGNFIYDSYKGEYFNYDTNNLPNEKGTRKKDGICVVNERYTYTFY